MVRIAVMGLLLSLVGCKRPGRECAEPSPTYARAPEFNCTAALTGSYVCPSGRAGWGYACNGQCWSMFMDGPCVALGSPPPPAPACAPADAGQPSLDCTATLEASIFCTASGDYQCRDGCWTTQLGGGVCTR